MKVVFATSEATPFAKTGGLADVVGELPVALASKGIEAIVIMPLYSTIKVEYRQKFEFIKHFDVYLGSGKQYVGVFKYVHRNVTFYFLDNEKYFKRDNLYGYDDEGERFSYYTVAFLETLSHLQIRPDIVHCNDWQTGMIPTLYHEHYKNFDYYQDIKFIFTVHNPAYQGLYPGSMLSDLLFMDYNLYDSGKLRFNNCLSFIKAGLVYADRITTVSKSYKDELCTREGSYGLDFIFNYRYNDFYGILNGVDYNLNNPETDQDIFFNYSKDDTTNKVLNKLEIQRRYGFEVNKDIPLIALVTRLTWQKGLDIFINILERLLSRKVQVLVIGSGDYEYESRLNEMASRYPSKLGVYIGYEPKLAKNAYASSDYFLMPSLFEPCGISQMIALRYGSLPIVREVGGLIDTVEPYNEYSKTGSGFGFKNYNSQELLNIIDYALSFYNKEDYKIIQKQAMSKDFSWDRSCEEYINLYKSLKK